VLHPALRLDGRGAADGGCLPRRRHGGDARRYRLSADRPLPAHHPPGADNRRGDQFRRRLSELFPRRRDRRHYRRAADRPFPHRLPPGAETRHARRPQAQAPCAGGKPVSETLDLLLLPFRIDFMQRAFLVTLMIAVPMAMLSCLLVLKGWSLMGDAVSHAVFPGVVIAYSLSI